MLFQAARPVEAFHWAMNHSPITIVAEGTFTLSSSIEVPRANVSLVIMEKATLVAAANANLTVISEGHGTYGFLVGNSGHDNVNIINFGAIASGRHIPIMVEGRSGGTCGIDGGMIFSCGELRGRRDAVWIVDARNIRVPLIWCETTANALAIEGCEDLSIGTVAELNAGPHRNEAIDLNSYSRRIHVELAIGTAGIQEVVDINNSPDCVLDEVRAYGKGPPVRFYAYGPQSRRLTQKPRITHSNGTVVKKEKVIEKRLKSWKTWFDVRDLPGKLPQITVEARLTAVFEDGSEEQVLDRTYNLDLSTPR
jgi:hypothetical protein